MSRKQSRSRTPSRPAGEISNHEKRSGRRGLLRDGDGTEVAVEHNEVWSGFLPHPNDLERYNEMIPNCAERILAMAENEQKHRIRMDEDALPSLVKSNKRGQYLGWALSMSAVIGTSILALAGADWRICVAIVGIPVLAVAQALVSSISPREDDNE